MNQDQNQNQNQNQNENQNHKHRRFRTLRKIRRFFKKVFRSVFFRRAVEVIGVELAISLIFAVLTFTVVSDEYKSVFEMTFAAAALYFGWTVVNLYRFRMRVRGKKRYYVVNGPVYGVFMVGAIITSIFNTEPIYTLLFMPFKLFHFAAKLWPFPGAGHMSRPLSAVLMSAVFALPVIVMPFFLSTKRKLRMRGIKVPPKTKESENNEINR